MVSTSAVKLQLLTSMRIYQVVNIIQIVRYKEQVEGQKKEKGKPIEVARFEEWEIEKILNKRKMRGVNRYLVRWKGFTVKNNIWERKEDLGNAKELVNKFEGRLSAKVRRLEKVETERRMKRNLRTEKYGRSKLLGKYIVVTTTRHSRSNNLITSKSLKRISSENSQENSTRSLCLIRVLYIQSPHGPCY